MGLSWRRGIWTVFPFRHISNGLNDIIVNKKKVCGMLTEMEVRGSQIKAVIIGVGINVNQKEFRKKLPLRRPSLMLGESCRGRIAYDKESRRGRIADVREDCKDRGLL